MYASIDRALPSYKTHMDVAEKRVIIDGILNEALQKGRFLEMAGNKWILVGDLNRARKKIGQVRRKLGDLDRFALELMFSHIPYVTCFRPFATRRERQKQKLRKRLLVRKERQNMSLLLIRCHSLLPETPVELNKR